MGAKDDSPEGKRARAERAFIKQADRDTQTSERVREEAMRVAALDAKTACLKALRLVREAEAAPIRKTKGRQ